MIEINLLPGTGKRGGRKKGMPKLGLGPLAKVNPGMPKFNSALLFTFVAWVGGAGLLGWMFVGGRAKKAELQSEIEAAVLDSARLAEIIKSTDQLNARMRAVTSKMTVVQEVDASRFIWPHLMDEISRAVPEYTWITRITNMPTDSSVKVPKFTVEGRTGNNFALTKYLQQLEASPFIRGVRLKSSELVRDNDKLVYAFALDADFEQPPPELLQTEPLFASSLEEGPANPRGNAQRSSAGRGGAGPARPGAAGPANTQARPGGNAPAKSTANAPAAPASNAAKTPAKPTGSAQTTAKPRTQEPR